MDCQWIQKMYALGLLPSSFLPDETMERLRTLYRHRDNMVAQKVNHIKNSNYKIFGLMMLTSFIMMYGIMFLNIFEIDHLYFSTTRTYMTLLMVALMAISILLFLWKIYDNKRMNLISQANEDFVS